MPGDEFDDGLGEIGGELDLDAVTRVATTVKRRPLDLGFEEMLPRQNRAGGREVGGASLDADAFLEQEEREARERARGGTPTLDRLGDSMVRPAEGRAVTMDRRLILRQHGMPTWGWVLLLIATFGIGIGIVLGVRWVNESRAVRAEAARIEAARGRLERLEQERQRKL